MTTTNHNEIEQSDSLDTDSGESMFDWKKLGYLLLVSAVLWLVITWVSGFDERFFVKGAELFEDERYVECVKYFRKSAK